MLTKILLLSILCYSRGDETEEDQKPLLVELTPKQIVEAFNDVMSDDYIKILAKDFATKAAAHFVQELRNQKESFIEKFNQERVNEEKLMTMNDAETRNKVDEMVAAVNDVVKSATKPQLDEDEALRLMQEPSPDGDHLESSGEFSEAEKKKNIPVIQVTKINGIYFRRFLGMI